MQVIFVYNADSGKLNTIFDTAHKIVSPSTYQCSLCSLTYGAFSEKGEWAKFRESSNANLEFLHKDEFEKRFTEQYEYPVVLDTTDGMKVLFSKDQLDKFESVEELISAIKEAVG
ncbi:MAG: GTPase [Gammaproteobacteria bacterium]|uniref:GTPase n=1 Tax=Candidatus Thiopontia autotrophica TaxID=2841688 RepID=A0A8J6P734_9GAMM|nr:GTPase [Candidatus Thiopontia autotrophica]MBL6969086.1 GTPase [Gammaproteobacteria bacterium]